MTFMRKFLDLLNMDNWHQNRRLEVECTSEETKNILFRTPNELSNSKMDNVPRQQNMNPLKTYYTADPISEVKTISTPRKQLEKCETACNVSFNRHGSPSLSNIKLFWKTYPQNYTDSNDVEIDRSTYLLYGKVLLLWAFGECCPIRNAENYPWYFANECHITNPQILHINLVNDGYLGLPSAREVFFKYKLPELKTIAESIGCKKSGKKIEIIDRIISSMDNSDLKNLIEDSRCYSLTEKGICFLEDNYDLVELHRHQNYDISLSCFLSNRFVGNKKRSFNDNAFQVISTRIFQNSLNRNYHLMSRDYQSLYDIALNEGRCWDAVECILNALYLKTCLTFDAPHYTNSSYYSEHADSVTVYTEHTASYFVKLREFYSPVYVDNIYKDYSLPPSFLSISEFKQSIVEMLTETMFDFEKYNKIIRKRLKTYIKI